jgi:hypothetical protein
MVDGKMQMQTEIQIAEKKKNPDSRKEKKIAEKEKIAEKR